MALHTLNFAWDYNSDPSITNCQIAVADAATGAAVASVEVGHTGTASVPGVPPGSYVATLKTVNKSPDPANPAFCTAPATKAFAVADANPTPPNPTGLTVTVV